MDKFIISSEVCEILTAFSQSESLRDAARLLGCDPAGLNRKIHSNLAVEGFLQKVQNRWRLTPKGHALVSWTQSSILSQRELLLSQRSIRIASTTWLAEELLIPNTEKLKTLVGSGSAIDFSVPDRGFEGGLLDASVDFVITCHGPENPEIEHRQIADEKWVAVAPLSWRKQFTSNKPPEKILERKPFIQHRSLNLDSLLPAPFDIQRAEVSFDNLIGVRSAVRAGHGWSVVPRVLAASLIEREEIYEVAIPINFKDRKVSVWWLRSRRDTKRLSTQVCAWVKSLQ